MDPEDIKRTIKEYYIKLYTYKYDNIDEISQFFKKHKLSQHIQYEIGNLSSPITI